MSKVQISKVNDRYLLEVKQWSPAERLVIDGVEHRDVKDGWLSSEPVSIAVRRVRTVTDGYRNKDSGDVLSVEIYDAQAGEWLSHRDSDWNWDDLDAEFSYRKFTAAHERMTHDEDYDEPCDVVRVDITGRTDNPHIAPLRMLQSEVPDCPLYKYTPNLVKMAEDVGRELGFERIEDKLWDTSAQPVGAVWSVPTHSHKDLEFMKIDGHYEYAKGDFQYPGLAVGTWEECEEKYNRHVAIIRRRFANALARSSRVRPESATLFALKKDADELSKAVARIKPMSKSHRDYTQAKTLVGSMVSTLQAAITSLATKGGSNG